jgi:hypothetical protein
MRFAHLSTNLSIRPIHNRSAQHGDLLHPEPHCPHEPRHRPHRPGDPPIPGSRRPAAPLAGRPQAAGGQSLPRLRLHAAQQPAPQRSQRSAPPACGHLFHPRGTRRRPDRSGQRPTGGARGGSHRPAAQRCCFVDPDGRRTLTARERFLPCGFTDNGGSDPTGSSSNAGSSPSTGSGSTNTSALASIAGHAPGFHHVRGGDGQVSLAVSPAPWRPPTGPPLHWRCRAGPWIQCQAGIIAPCSGRTTCGRCRWPCHRACRRCREPCNRSPSSGR